MKSFFFDLSGDCIDVMPQPIGSLYGATLTNDCKTISEAKDIFISGTLGFDPGFGTLDTFVIQNGFIKEAESFDNIGMKAVYKRLAQKIEGTYGKFIPTHAVQNVLLEGRVWIFNKETRQTEQHQIAGLLDQSNQEVCVEALRKLDTTYDYLQDYRYLLVTGGTSEAWRRLITEHYAGMQHLRIIYGNQNVPNLPQIFSNVRGYYLRRVGILRAQK